MLPLSHVFPVFFDRTTTPFRSTNQNGWRNELQSERSPAEVERPSELGRDVIWERDILNLLFQQDPGDVCAHSNSGDDALKIRENPVWCKKTRIHCFQRHNETGLQKERRPCPRWAIASSIIAAGWYNLFKGSELHSPHGRITSVIEVL